MPTVAVLGAGMVGSIIAADLAATRGFNVTLHDHSRDALDQGLERCRRVGRKNVKAIEADLSDPVAVRAIAAESDLVAGALPSHLGFAALKAVIEAERPYADISFMADDALELDRLAKRKGVTAIVDIGVAPGMSNLLAGVAAKTLKPCERIDIMVGGLPVERQRPFEYKAAFAPADVLEEYVRPARIVEGGKTVIREALGGIEPVDLPGVGTVEAFDTDGLRSLVHTLKVPFMRERTLRWPGHAALMRAFRDAGLLDTEPVEVRGQRVVPRDLLATLLFPKWSYTSDDEGELTVMRVVAEGKLDRKRVRLTWDLLDHRDPETGFTSMSRTTAFPCAVALRALAKGEIPMTGVIPPERLASIDGFADRMIKELRKRGVRYEAEVGEC